MDWIQQKVYKFIYNFELKTFDNLKYHKIAPQ